MAAIDEKVKDEHKINSELPEHLREEVDEGKIRDTSSIFSGEEPEIKHVPLIKESETTEPEKRLLKLLKTPLRLKLLILPHPLPASLLPLNLPSLLLLTLHPKDQ